MKSFSQRKGLKPVPEVAQIGAMNAELRSSLWNALDATIWATDGFIYGSYWERAGIEEFSYALWDRHFKRPADSRPGIGSASRGRLIYGEIRAYFFASEWNEVYDFLEFVVSDQSEYRPLLQVVLNQVLERELAGYKFIGGLIVDITDEQECALLAEVLADTRFGPVTAHLERALQLFADRMQPDYRNSIKESISAVEAMAQVAAQTPKASLGDALKVIEKKAHLHPALKDGFTKLYGYTSDADGIRHAMLDESKVDQNDARYFLLSCTSFINYLKVKLT